MKRRDIRFMGIASAVIVGLSAAGVAFATPGSGVTGMVAGRGTAVEKVKTRGNEPYDVIVQSITIAPGGHTGWHTHPGIAVAVVTSGGLTVYDGDDRSCTAQLYEAGDVYVDPGYGHVHIARNEGAVPTVVLVTYLDVPTDEPTTVIRIDADDPGNCSFSP
jgi:quercetin dioxygenase-like cupin family protein